MQKYVEIFIENDLERKYRYFAFRDEKKVRRKADKQMYYDFEVITGERIVQNVSLCDSPMYLIKNYNYNDFNIYYHTYLTNDEFYSLESFDELKTKTAENIPNFKNFLQYREVKSISAEEIKEYLQEIDESGLLEDYHNHLKELVLELQREYVTTFTPYYETIREEKRKMKEEEERQMEAGKFIISLRKKLNNNKKVDE